MAKKAAKSGTPAALNELAKAAREPANKGAYVKEGYEQPEVIGDTIVTQPSKVNVRAADNLSKMVEGRPVQFDADCGYFHTVVRKGSSVIDEHGKPHVIGEAHEYVDFSKGPISLNPGNPRDLNTIKILRSKIENATQDALVNGLMEVGDGQIPALADGWATMHAQNKLKMVKLMPNQTATIEKAIKWELQNDGDAWLVKQLDALLAPKEQQALSVAEPVVVENVDVTGVVADVDSDDEDADA